jgi:hypothetical protein
MVVVSSNPFDRLLEYIVVQPLRATLAVGTSILLLLALIEYVAGYWPMAATIKFIVPFIPPFFITRTAKRINSRLAEHDFIRDAEPYIFVAYPKEATVEALLCVKPSM